MKNEKLLSSVIAGINITLGAFINYLTYDFVGVGLFIVGLFIVATLKDTRFAHWLVQREILTYDVDAFFNEECTNQLLLSVAVLSIDMKICAAIGLIIEGGAALLVAIGILTAFGYLFEGPEGGMTIGGAFAIAKLLAKIGSFILSIWERVIIFIAKIEFGIFGIELKGNGVR